MELPLTLTLIDFFSVKGYGVAGWEKGLGWMVGIWDVTVGRCGYSLVKLYPDEWFLHLY